MGYDIVGFGDTQIPFHDWKALHAAAQWARQFHWDAGIWFGDNLDFDYLSKFSEGKPGLMEGRRLEDDFEKGREFLHDVIAPAIRHKNPDAKVYVLEGNHEKRIKTYYDKHSYTRGMFDFPVQMKMDDIDAQWVKCDSEGELLRFEWLTNGEVRPRIYRPTDRVKKCYGVSFIHGKYHSINHAKKHLDDFNIGPIYYGHLHDLQRMPIKGFGADVDRGGCVGCLCRLDMQYMEGRPSKWEHAVCEWNLSDQPGIFDDPVHRIIDGKVLGE